jgi:selenide,water dikinase
MATLAEAGVALVGGHSIKDDEIKLGFAVTGTIDPAVARSLEQARPGDLLVLTKPLGTGVIAFGRQVGRTLPGEAEAERSMATLNRGAAEAMREAGASACTDITGFGLLGHLLRLSRQSGLAAELDAAALPAFPGVLEALRSNVISGAIERNREYVSDSLELEPGLDEAFVHLGCDPQTSGGLLIAIAPEKLPRLRLALADRQQPGWVIGRFGTFSEARIRLRSAQATAPSPSQHQKTGTTEAMKPSQDPQFVHGPGCCSDIFETQKVAALAASGGESAEAFAALMRSVQAGGALDEKIKELILFALVIASRCEPCFKSHWERAKELGLTQEQLDEAAWCAVAMGGAPVRMFYREAMARCASSAGSAAGGPL